jgi:DNA-binding transcriptional LysR family regulator
MLNLFETFVAVAEVGSLTRATERLHLTQPAITRQLRALERELGAVLLSRSPKGVALTPVGERVLPHAREAVAAVRACREAAGAGGVDGSTRPRIASGLMATLYVLPPVVARFRELHPEVEVDLQPTHQRIAVERLLGYEVDVAVIASPVRSAQLRATPIVDDPLLLVGPPGQAVEPTRLAELAGQLLLVLPNGTGLHGQVLEAFRRRKVAAQLVEHPTAETIKTAVRLGMGATILPTSAVREELAAGMLSGRPIADWPGATRVVQLLTRADGREPESVRTFRRLLQEQYGRLSKKSVAGPS